MAHLKYILYVFIPVLIIFAMSHNVFASDVVVNATPTGSGITCMTWVNPVNVSAPTCNAIQNTNADLTGSVEGINATISGTYYTDSVIELSFTFYKVNNSASLHSIVNGVRQDNSIDTGWDMIGYDYSNLDTNTGKLTLLFKHRVNSGNFNARLRGNYGTLLFALMPSDRVVGINYTIYAITNANAGSQAIVDAINSQPNYSNNLNTINNSINNLNSGISDINNHNEKEEQAAEDIENQTTEDVQVGDQSGMTNAVGVVSGIFNQIGSVQATDCNFTANFGHLNLGNLNFCTGKENFPFIINFVSSIFTLIVVVGTILILVRQILGLYDWARKD